MKSIRGEYYLNGHWTIEGARALPVASTVLHYERGAEGDLAPERLHARGPTSEPLIVEVNGAGGRRGRPAGGLRAGRARPPGIRPQWGPSCTAHQPGAQPWRALRVPPAPEHPPARLQLEPRLVGRLQRHVWWR